MSFLRRRLRIQAGRIGDAAQAAAKLCELGSATAAQLYNAACVYSLAAAAVAKGKPQLSADDQAVRDGYADAAVAVLGRAVAAGYNDLAHMKSDSDLDAIRSHAGYKAFVESKE